MNPPSARRSLELSVHDNGGDRSADPVVAQHRLREIVDQEPEIPEAPFVENALRYRMCAKGEAEDAGTFGEFLRRFHDDVMQEAEQTAAAMARDDESLRDLKQAAVGRGAP